jgi:hypothetical protein
MTDKSSAQQTEQDSASAALAAERKRSNTRVVVILACLALGFYLYTILGGLAI